MKQSTTEKGDELRDYVIEILEANGHKIRREVRVDTKKIDVFLELDDEFVPRTVLIECKNVDHVIGQKELAIIFVDHESLLERKRADELWVVSCLGYSPEAKGWAEAKRNFHAFTLAELEERQHGFRMYVRQLMSIFEDQDLNHYYVRQRYSETGYLDDYLMEWLEADSDHPVALLGGYGMGKTSFCKYIVSKLAKEYLKDATLRVAVYVKLSDFAKQQDLEGLLGKTLGDTYRIKDYYFQKIRKLNDIGKFLLIFDGFDEMKHALTWKEFKYNFGQINRLVTHRAKVLIAGRPNAFLSDDEHSWALRGVRVAGDRPIRLPEWPSYQELDLQPFSDEEARIFLRRYLENYVRCTKGEDAVQGSTGWIEHRLVDFDSVKRRDVVTRPVHLKIFSDLATNPNTSLSELNVYDLYDISTKRVAEREAEKHERAAIDPDVKQSIIEDVAWWLWEKSDGRELSFHPYDIPSSYIRRAFPDGSDLSQDAMYREIFSGSFIERKYGENYYFSHRSFVEFFVARRLSKSREHKLPVSTITQRLNPEVLTFIRDGGHLDKFVSYLLELLQRFSGEIELYAAKEVKDFVQRKNLGVDNFQASVQLLLRYLHIYEGDLSEQFIVSLKRSLARDFLSNNKDISEGALYFAVDFARANTLNLEARPLLNFVIHECVDRVDWRYWSTVADAINVPKPKFTRQNIFEFAFLRASRVAAESDEHGRPIIVVDFERFFSDLSELRRPKITVTGRKPDPSSPRSVRFTATDFMEKLSAKDRATFLDLLRAGAPLRIV